MADRTFVNAKVFTGEGEESFVSAFRVSNGRIAWTGAESDVDETGAIDLGGRTVLPGLIDSHTHPAMMAATASAVECFPPTVASVGELVERLRAHGASGEGWIVGRGFDDAAYPGRRMPTAADLDEVSTTRPVLVWRCDAHSAVCNSVALRLAGITAETPNPDGARFERRANGEPNGVLTEMAAVEAVARHIPPPTREEQIDALVAIGDGLAAHGIVAACDLLSDRIADPLGTFRAAAERGMRTRIALYPEWNPARPLSDLAPGDREGDVRIGGVKVVLDGAYANRTAWVVDPYPDSCDHGLRLVDDADARAAAAWARRNRVQLAVHAMGDRAIERVVELFGGDEPWLDGVPSIRIEHATLVSGDLASRLRDARMSFGVATHTVFFFAEYRGYVDALGPAQVPDAYPIRRLYDAVEPLALSSDRPATAWSDADDVMLSIEAAVRRRAHTGADFAPEQGITVAQAALLYTGRARLLSPLEGVGTLTPGADASFAVLDRDLFTVPDHEISRVRVAETWIRGERIPAPAGAG